MIETIKFRPGKPRDYDAVSTTAIETLNVDAGAAREDFEADMLHWRARKLSTVVAEDAQSVIGHAIVHPYKIGPAPDPYSRTMMLSQLAVRSTHQGRGIGSELLSLATRSALKFDAALLVAQVGPSSASFYEDMGWTVCKAGDGLGFIEAESAHDSGARKSSDVVGRLSKAATIRGLRPLPVGGTTDRHAYRILNEGAVVRVFPVATTKWNPSGFPGRALIEEIMANPDVLMSMPLSIVLTVIADLSERLGKARAEELTSAWVRENPVHAAEMPGRLGLTGVTTDQIFMHLFTYTPEARA